MTMDQNNSTCCLICNVKIKVNVNNFDNLIPIFEDSIVGSDKSLADLISLVLQKEIIQENVYSSFICKNCHQLFAEYSVLEKRLITIKEELSVSYQKSEEQRAEADEIVASDHNYVDQINSSVLNESNDSGKVVSIVEDVVIKEDQDSQMSTEMFETEEEFIEDEYFEFVEEDDEIVEEMDVKPELSLIDVNSESSKGPSNEVVSKSKAVDDKSKKINTKNVNKKKGVTKTTEIKRTKRRKRKQVDSSAEDALPEQIVLQDDSNYSCIICSNQNEEFKGNDKEIVIHMKTIHDLRLYICDVCGDDFRKRNDLSAHLDEHVATEEGDFQCEVCNRIFTNLRLFRIHKRIHYPQSKCWPCEICGKRYSSKNLLDEHINTHNGYRPHICENCGKSFTSKYTFKAHLRTHEDRPRPFECLQCNKTFLSLQNLNQHEKTHLGIKEFVCKVCSKAFGSLHNLEVHNIVHTGYKPYICHICGKSFARKAEIKDHERIHTGEKPYHCEFCSAQFSQRSNLQSHKRATHFNDKRYKCDICEKGFKRRRLLDYHIKAIHTGERPYKCESCPATFVYPEHFKKHLRIHTGEKPYHCEKCGKAFNSRDNRNAHRYVHSLRKPYGCGDCKVSFMRKPLLVAHCQISGHKIENSVFNPPDFEGAANIPESEILLNEDEDVEQIDNSELYIADLKDQIIIEENENGDSVLSIPSEKLQHVVVDSQIEFDEDCKMENVKGEMYAYENEKGETVVLPADADISEIIGKNQVKFFQIKLPIDSSEGSKNWINLVQQQT